MQPAKSLRAVTAASPLALAAILAAAPQASAGINGATLDNPRVLDSGKTLSVMLSSDISDDTTDDAVARNVADTFAGDWAGGLIENAMRNTPRRVSTCRVTATASDPNGATGTASTAVPTGVTSKELRFPARAPGGKWGVGDVDHFAVQLACTGDQKATPVGKATIDQDETAV